MMLDFVTASARELRDYQAQAIDDLRGALRQGDRRVVLQAPTGYGKTVLASHVVKMARDKGKRVVFTVPALDLIDQTLESFWADGVGDIGVIQADHIETDWSRPVQIASVQTLARRPFPEADLVIVDECHRAWDVIPRWMAATEAPFIGLSATPWTRGLGKHWGRLLISATTAKLIDMGHLSPFRVFAPSHPDLAGVKTVAGDYHEGQLAEAMNKSPLVADVVETWIRRGENRPTLCFGVDRAHAKHLQQRFEGAGIACGYQDAYTDKTERAKIKRAFHTGEFKVVCNVGTLTTGVDWDVRCIILARPTKSEILYVQIVGRGLRTAMGKQDLLLLDHSDTTLKLGMVTDIHHDSLDDGSQRAKADNKAPALKECPECAYLRPASVRKCPNCGHLAEPPLPLPHQEGELVELTRRGGTSKVSASEIQLRGRKIPLKQFFAELLAFAEMKGYNRGWATHKFKEAVGSWPRHCFSPVGIEATPTSYEVLSWIKSRQIAWAKQRKAS